MFAVSAEVFLGRPQPILRSAWCSGKIPPTARFRLRQEKARPIWDELRPCLDRNRHAPPQSLSGKAIGCLADSRLEPYAYLRHIFEKLPQAITLAHMEALLPWNVAFKATR